MSAVSKNRCGRILTGAASLLLLLSLTGCAASPTAPVVILPAKCEHPRISPYDAAGLIEAVTLYHRAVETCNALNGHAPGLPDGVSDRGAGVATQK